MKKNKKEIIKYAIVYGIIFILLFAQHNIVSMYFDDFGNAALTFVDKVVDVTGTNYTLSQVFQTAAHTYFNFGGRVMYGIFVTLLLKNGIKPFMIMQVFIILGIIANMHSIISFLTKKNNVFIPITLMILYMLMSLSIVNDGVYWASASVLYVWPLLPIFGFINYYIRVADKIKNKKKVNYWIYLLINISLLFLAVFSQEQLGVGLIGFFLVYIFFDHIKEEKKYLKYDLTSLIIMISTYLVLFLAPGNWARMAKKAEFVQMNIFDKVLYRYPHVMDLLFRIRIVKFINIIIVLLITFGLYYYIKNNKKNSKYSLMLFPLTAFIIHFTVYRKNYLYIYFSEYLLNIYGTMMLLALGSMLIFYYYKSKTPKMSSFLVGGCGTIFCMLMAPYSTSRVTIPCIFFFMIVIITMGLQMYDMKNKTIRVLLIVFLCISSYFAIENYYDIYRGYKLNYPINQDNFNKCKNYKDNLTENNTIELCKVKDEVYGSVQSYMSDYDHWIKDYFAIPQDVKLNWNDCNG